jgi:signal transduction histidine kinase/CheY-like chemotaxis protein
MKGGAADILKLYTAALPVPAGELDELTLENQLFLENCADRLASLGGDGGTRLKALEAVSMSLDGLTQRFTLRKGMSFHCGAEVTAVDAVATLVRVLKLKHSVSQLARHVARDKGQPHGFAVYTVSRYRFELRLTHRLDDLLARLALPECSLRHEGRACFSGPWKVVEQDAAGILLAVHAAHPEAGDCQYQGVRWEIIRPSIDDPAVFGQPAQAEPYLLIYPGTRLKSPPEELLTDEICRPLDAGMTLFMHVHSPSTMTSELRARFALAVRDAFGGNSLWRRAPLTAFVPKGHALHAMPLQDPPPEVRSRLSLRLSAQDGVLPAHMWDKLRRTAADAWQLDLDVITEAATPVRVAATIGVLLHGHAADIRTPLAQLAEREALDQPGGRHDPAQELLRQRHYVPFLHVPFVVRSNRNVRRRDTTGFLHFADVRQSGDRLRKLRLKDTALRALGEAVQMFAHDVRRPFSLMQGILGLLEATDDPVRARELSIRYLPDVRRAAGAADRMIQDILEIGSDAEPMVEEIELTALIGAAVRDAFAARVPPGLRFDYRLRHTHQLNVDPRKLLRVLANLLSNASEAMQFSGTIWFEATPHPTERLTLLTVGNTGSFIPPEMIDGLFDRFFTEGKQQGTGLGLAIVKKIVNDHGGDVWCESDREQGTRFTMSLPSAATRRGGDTVLPTDARAAASAAGAATLADAAAPLARLAAQGGVTLLLVDDDPLYLAVMQELLPNAWRRQGAVRLLTATDAAAAINLVSSPANDVNVAVVDVDLGRHSIDGLALVRQLRAMRPGIRICVHSHGAPFELTKQAVQAGGDLFLPKPMARDHLLKLLQSLLPQAGAPLPTLAVVDDDALMLEIWRTQSAFQWVAFDSPQALLAAATPDALASWAGVVTDLHFDGNDVDGVALAGELKQRRADLPIFLATDKPLVGQVPAGIDRVVKKEPEAALAIIAATLAR